MDRKELLEKLAGYGAELKRLREDCVALDKRLDQADRNHKQVIAELAVENGQLKAKLAMVKDLADEGECEYGDGCPDNAGTRHGRCMHCKLVMALAAEPPTLTPDERRRRYTAGLCPNCGIHSDYVNERCSAHGTRQP